MQYIINNEYYTRWVGDVKGLVGGERFVILYLYVSIFPFIHAVFNDIRFQDLFTKRNGYFKFAYQMFGVRSRVFTLSLLIIQIFAHHIKYLEDI